MSRPGSANAPTERVVLLGPPGAGKGTQGELLARSLGVPHIVSSDVLNAHIEAATALGIRARERMDAGELVEDDVVVGIVCERLGEPDAEHGFLLDGFPRSTPQAEALEAWLTARNLRLDAAVLLEVARAVLLNRLSARAAAEDRSDDDAATVAHRLDVYDAETAPLAEYYNCHGALRRVNGDGSVPTAAQRVLAALGLH